MVLCDSAWAFSGSGSGTMPDPYIITDVYQLQEMQNDLAASYVLGNDIDASGTVSWNGGEGFEPIGQGANPFIGTFYGQGHTITGLFINRSSNIHVGLFGFTDSSAVIQNGGLSDADVTGSVETGTLVGYNNGSIISCCWASGRAVGTSSHRLCVSCSSGRNRSPATKRAPAEVAGGS